VGIAMIDDMTASSSLWGRRLVSSCAALKRLLEKPARPKAFFSSAVSLRTSS
jgi:hypothetical protein